MATLQLFLVLSLFSIYTFQLDVISLDNQALKQSYQTYEDIEELPLEGRSISNIITRQAKDAPKQEGTKPKAGEEDKKNKQPKDKGKEEKQPGKQKQPGQKEDKNKTEPMTMEKIIQNLKQEIKEVKANVSRDMSDTKKHIPFAADTALKTQQDSQDAQQMGNSFYDKADKIDKEVKEIMVQGFGPLQFLFRSESKRMEDYLSPKMAQSLVRTWLQSIPSVRTKEGLIRNYAESVNAAKQKQFQGLQLINNMNQGVHARMEEVKKVIEKQKAVLTKLKSINVNNNKQLLKEWAEANSKPQIFQEVTQYIQQLSQNMAALQKMNLTQDKVKDLVIPKLPTDNETEVSERLVTQIKKGFIYPPNAIKSGYQEQLDESYIEVLELVQKELNDSKKRWEKWEKYKDEREKRQNLNQSFAVQKALVDNVTNATNEVNRLIPKLLRVKVKILTLLLFVLTVLVLGLGSGAFLAYGLTKLWRSISSRNRRRMEADAANRHWQFCEHF